MAKVLGLTNTNLKGKIGNTVFFVRKGESLARQYQPTVANPKTVLQLRQRNKLSQAVSLNKSIRAALQKLVGTGSGRYEYQGIQKVIMNSLCFKQYQAPTNQMTGNALATFRSGMNLKNVMDALGNNYSFENLNIFEPEVTIGAGTTTANGLVRPTPLVIKTTTGEWNSFVSEAAEPVHYIQFGCDYELGSELYIIAIAPNSTFANGTQLGSLQYMTLNITPADTTNVTFEGYKRRGVAIVEATEGNEPKANESLGAGWKYYYKFEQPTAAFSPSTAINVVDNINGQTQNAMLYGLALIIATSSSSSVDGIQILKGYSYNTYTPEGLV